MAPKVCLDHTIVSLHLRGGPPRNLLTIAENKNPIRDVHHHLHVMLDEEDGLPIFLKVPDQIHHHKGHVRGEPGHGFI